MMLPSWDTAPPSLMLLFFALALDALVPKGTPVLRAIPEPRRVFRLLLRDLDRRLNRAKRSRRTRLIRGALVTLVAAIMGAGLGWAMEWAAQWATGAVRYGWVVEPVAAATLLGQGAIFAGVRTAIRALRAGRTKDARAALGELSGFPPLQADLHGLARAAIEACASGFSCRVIAPVFWYAFLGLPGMAASAAINEAAAVFGQPAPRYAAFGLMARRLDDALGAIPSRLAALALCLAAVFTPGANPARAVATMWHEADKHPSFNAGWPLAAMAGAFALSLAGPTPTSTLPWLGAGRARATPADVGRALYLFAIACLLTAAVVALIVAWSATA